MTNLLEQKVAVVTGGTTGIGLAIARQFSYAGAKVIVTGLDRESLDRVAAEHDHEIIGQVADAGDVDEMQTFLRTVRDRHGSLDILVLNAVYDAHAPLGQITEEQFDNMMRVNLRGPLFSVQSAAPLMHPGGSIILIGSTASVAPPAGMAIYGAVKAGLRGMMRSLIQDLKGTGIRLNLLSPGAVDTESLKRALVKAAGEEKADSIIASIGDRSPLGRIGDPAEVARAALFLASDMASYVNGAELFADGGLTNV